MPKVFITGHRGMVGSALVRAVEKNCPAWTLLLADRKQLDLLDQISVDQFLSDEKPDYIVNAAARVGGIHANNSYPGQFIYENLMIEANIIHSAFKNGVKKLLFLGSSCIYPKLADQPMKESALLSGKLEPTNEPYAIAKIAGIKVCESYNRQYGRDYRSVMPSNLYGPGDNYQLGNSHVVPALIRRFHEAKKTKRKQVVVWGTGTPKREFLFVDDMAEASLFVHNLDQAKYIENTQTMLSHINVGTGVDVTIKELAQTIKEVVGFTGKLVFDHNKPDGTTRKLMDVTRLTQLGYSASTKLKTGLELSYADFLQNSSILRM